VRIVFVFLLLVLLFPFCDNEIDVNWHLVISLPSKIQGVGVGFQTKTIWYWLLLSNVLVVVLSFSERLFYCTVIVLAFFGVIFVCVLCIHLVF
jgi:hypothetical protein